MNIKKSVLLSCLLLTATWTIRAQHPFICADSYASKVAVVSADRKIVWEFADHTHFKTINQIQLLDIPGDVTKGEIFR